MLKLTCRSAAKVNLTLDILGQRSDGYHELQSVVHTVGLWDSLAFEFDGTAGLELRCNHPQLATESNLCLQAARGWLAALGSTSDPPFTGLRITLEKHIPFGAGLGGGSGNAAAVLLALNRAFNAPLTDTALAQVAATLGADVPFFLRGGCALMEGIGERLTPLPTLSGWLVILKPPMGFSTPEIYRQWDGMGRASGRGSAAMQSAVEMVDLGRVAKALQNDLSYAARPLGLAYTDAQRVDIEALGAALRAHGALGATMTGSGSAVFGLFEHEGEARQAAQKLQRGAAYPAANAAVEPTHQVFVAPFCQAGVEFPGAAPASMP